VILGLVEGIGLGVVLAAVFPDVGVGTRSSSGWAESEAWGVGDGSRAALAS